MLRTILAARPDRPASATRPAPPTRLSGPVALAPETSVDDAAPARGLRQRAADGGRTPSRRRRTAVAVTGALACLVPSVFTVTISGMLLTGQLADHRFHQLTGQGLLLTALWLGALVPLLRAGWSGRRPSTAAALHHVSFVAGAAITASVAPGGGAPGLAVLVAVTGALVWLALPVRPRLRRPGAVALDPVLAPVALLGAALLVPYAMGQLALQNAATGHHAQNPHFSDMAWVALVLVALATLASLRVDARHLVRWTAAGSALIGVAGLAFTPATGFAGAALALGLLAAAAEWLRVRLQRAS